MLVIIEGIDRVGKTTLANRMVNELGFDKFEVIKKPIRKSETEIEQVLTKTIETEKIYSVLPTLKIIDKNNVNMLFDRFHISEYVYGLVDRRYVNKSMFEVDKILSKFNNIVLILVNPIDIEKSSIEHGSDLKLHYIEMNKFFNISHIENKIACTYNDFDEVINFLQKEMIK
jgi:thymidylate kinase